LGTTAVELLRRVTVSERASLREFTHDADTRDALFWMAEAGLLVITGGCVLLRRPMLRHALVLSGPIEPAPLTSTTLLPSRALHQAATAQMPCETTIVQAAAAHLERGLLEQARFLATALADNDPRRICLTASLQAVYG